jgi:hypothetical protein
MALASTAAENGALNGLAGVGSTNLINWVSLHSASPSTSGANENAATGGYTRQAETWNAASAGSMTNSGAMTFSTSGTIAVTHFGSNNASGTSGGQYAIGGALTASVTSASITFAAGSITLSAT